MARCIGSLLTLTQDNFVSSSKPMAAKRLEVFMARSSCKVNDSSILRSSVGQVDAGKISHDCLQQKDNFPL
jgi:hypothetical protein